MKRSSVSRRLVSASGRALSVGAGGAVVSIVQRGIDASPVNEVLIVPARDAAGELAERVRDHILGSAFGGPSTAFHRDPEALVVRLVADLISNERPGKTSKLVQRRES